MWWRRTTIKTKSSRFEIAHSPVVVSADDSRSSRPTTMSSPLKMARKEASREVLANKEVVLRQRCVDSDAHLVITRDLSCFFWDFDCRLAMIFPRIPKFGRTSHWSHDGRGNPSRDEKRWQHRLPHFKIRLMSEWTQKDDPGGILLRARRIELRSAADL